MNLVDALGGLGVVPPRDDPSVGLAVPARALGPLVLPIISVHAARHDAQVLEALDFDGVARVDLHQAPEPVLTQSVSSSSSQTYHILMTPVPCLTTNQDLFSFQGFGIV